MTKDQLWDVCLSYINLPYRWAGDDGIEGFDCSGLVLEILKTVGLVSGSLDINSQTIHDYFLKRSRTNAPGFGSLCFYGRSTKEITHVAFMISDTHILEAGGGGSSTTTKEIASKQNAYVRIRPYTNRNDLVAVLKLNYPWKEK